MCQILEDKHAFIQLESCNVEVKSTKVNKARPTNPSKAFDKHVGSYIRTIVTNEFPNLIKDFLFIRELNLGCVRVSLLLSLTRKILLLYTAWKPVKLEVPSLLFPNVFEFDITFTKKCEYKNYSIYTFRFPKEFSLFTNKEK